MPLPENPKHPANVGFRRSKTRAVRSNEALVRLIRALSYDASDELAAELNEILKTLEKA